jgi:hypothetical protein
VFDAKAGASLTAQAVMVGEVNTALAWQTDSMVASLGYRDAASGSAAAAVISATSAADSAKAATKNGVDQVSLAITAKNAAQIAQTSAEVAAQAAQAAVGLPAYVDGLDVLQVKSDKTGIRWGKVGQAIGDTLVTVRVPDATYLPCKRGVYSQSSFPDLYALLGCIIDLDRVAPSSPSLWPGGTTNSIQYMQYGNGIVLAVSSGGTDSFISSDGGVTWVKKTLPFSVSVSSFKFGNGVFVLAQNANTSTYYTTVDGVTWSTRSLPVAKSFLVGFVAGLFLMTVNNEAGYYTSSDGVAWSFGSSFPGSNSYQLVRSVSAGSRLYYFSQSSMYCYTEDGLTFYQSYVPLTFQQIGFVGGRYFAVAQNMSGFYVSMSGSGPISNWSYVPVAISISEFSWTGCVVSETVISFFNSVNGCIVSYDNGVTWSERILNLGVYSSAAVNGKLLIASASAVATWRLRSYDAATQFITPLGAFQPAPFNTFIKSKLL